MLEQAKDHTEQRIAILIQYIGTNYHGWQRQPQHDSIQAQLESALASVLGYPVHVHGAGRTDSGVHAAAQVAHFDVSSKVPAHRWASILSQRLPHDIVIRASAGVSRDWHARFSALWRRYRYTIYTDSKPNLFVRPFTWHYYRSELDTEAMTTALYPLLGRHHLAAFHRAGSSRAHSWVNIQDVVCVQEGKFVRVEVQASGFLYGMMRLLMGTLVDVGRGWYTPDLFTEIWQSQARDKVKYAAPPQGLCFLNAGYDHMPFERSLWENAQPLFCLV